MPEIVYTVRQFNREVRQLLESNYKKIWIQGEVSNLAAPGSGHLYFTLKDANAQIRCALFRNRRAQFSTEVQNGLAVQLRGQISLYEARGEFQIIVDFMEPAGEGELRRRFELLKQKLDQEGLFNSATKRAIPRMPLRIGIITSATGAAIRDILTTLQRRYPVADVLIYPVTVQGELASLQISAAIANANHSPTCQVLILARGGGTLEDLWAFNEEMVVRAIFESNLPVITGIGHEVDVTLSDLAADLRAATPTAAAECASPDSTELLASLNICRHRLWLSINRVRQQQAQHLDLLNSRLRHPADRLSAHRQQLVTLTARTLFAWQAGQHQYEVRMLRLVQQLSSVSPLTQLQRGRLLSISLNHRLKRACRDLSAKPSQELSSLAARLQSLSPNNTLNRGYAILRIPRNGRLVTNAASLQRGQTLHAELARGSLYCTVDQVNGKTQQVVRSAAPFNPPAPKTRG